MHKPLSASRLRFRRRATEVTAAMSAIALAVLANLGVLGGQWHQHSDIVSIVAGFIVVNVVADLAGDALERGGERYATERSFLGLRLRGRSSSKRGRSDDR